MRGENWWFAKIRRPTFSLHYFRHDTINSKQKPSQNPALAVLKSLSGSETSKNPIFSFNYVQGASPRRNYKICVITSGVIPTCSGRRCLSTSLINAITYSSTPKGLLSPLKMYLAKTAFSRPCVLISPFTKT